jgi:hypothetical protein
VEALRVNQRAVVHDEVDGEVIAVNLETGSYYSLQGSAAVCWNAIVGTTAESALVALLARRYAVSPESVQADVARFVQELTREALVVREERAAPSAPVVGGPAGDAAGPYAPPALRAYEDMRDLLLLDPIHDVDPTGWPVPRPEGSAG